MPPNERTMPNPRHPSPTKQGQVTQDHNTSQCSPPKTSLTTIATSVTTESVEANVETTNAAPGTHGLSRTRHQLPVHSSIQNNAATRQLGTTLSARTSSARLRQPGNPRKAVCSNRASTQPHPDPVTAGCRQAAAPLATGSQVHQELPRTHPAHTRHREGAATRAPPSSRRRRSTPPWRCCPAASPECVSIPAKVDQLLGTESGDGAEQHHHSILRVAGCLDPAAWRSSRVRSRRPDVGRGKRQAATQSGVGHAAHRTSVRLQARLSRATR